MQRERESVISSAASSSHPLRGKSWNCFSQSPFQFLALGPFGQREALEGLWKTEDRKSLCPRGSCLQARGHLADVCRYHPENHPFWYHKLLNHQPQLPALLGSALGIPPLGVAAETSALQDFLKMEISTFQWPWKSLIPCIQLLST